MPMKMESLAWGLIDRHMQSGWNRASISISSYNSFLKHGLSSLFASTPVVQWGKLAVEIGGADGKGYSFTLPSDSVSPMECRLFDKTYQVDVIVDLVSGESRVPVKIFSLPIMIGSNVCITNNSDYQSEHELDECRYDEGGYFIIEGKEKALCTIETSPVNGISISSSANSKYIAQFSTFTANGGRCVLRAFGDGGIFVTLTQGNKTSTIPLTAAFRVMYPHTDYDIVERVSGSQVFISRSSVLDGLRASLKDGLDWGVDTFQIRSKLGKLLRTSPEKAVAIMRSCLPGSSDYYRVLTLAENVNFILRYLRFGDDGSKDRDSYENKMLLTPGAILQSSLIPLWREYVGGLIARVAASNALVKDGVEQPLDDMRDSIISDAISKSLLQGFRSSSDDSVTGVYDVPRLTLQGAMSYSGRVVNMISSLGSNHAAPHRVHPSQVGFLCPVETPEGKQVGLVNNFTTMARVSDEPLDVKQVLACLVDCGLVTSPHQGYTTVCIDDVVHGWVKRPQRMCKLFRESRRSGKLHPHVSIAWTCGNNLVVGTSTGRLLRPLIISEALDGVSVVPKTWDLCLPPSASRGDLTYYDKGEDDERSALVEYVDATEVGSLFIAELYDSVLDCHTHIEIHPSCVLSPVAALTPFSHRNQAPRNVFSCKQTKACTSVYSTRYRYRFDVDTNVLHYGQRPLVDTMYSKYYNTNEMPYGVNAIVALACFTGYNQEDSVILNQTSLERGMFVSTHINTITKDENSRDGGVFCNPLRREVSTKGDSYSTISDNGLPVNGIFIYPKRVLIGHITNTDGVRDDTSVLSDLVTHGHVHESVLFQVDGDRRVKVCLHETRVPTVGDKFASRHGQKGVCGRVLKSEDMPFTSEGLVPDIIINPHAIPSRMTIGQLLEVVGAKAAAIDGEICDGTNGCGPSSDQLYSRLSSCGQEGWASDVLHDPRTGECQSCDVTIGPTYYMRLKQMVSDKINASWSARRDVVTGQPVRGRAEGGGLRVGEMERDSILANGMAMFLHESMTTRSDVAPSGHYFSAGLINARHHDVGTVPLYHGDDRNDVIESHAPKSLGLLQGELLGMGISMKCLNRPMMP